MDKWQMITVLSASLGSGVLVILSWINSSARTSRLEQGQDRLLADLEKVRAELRSESIQTRHELRTEFKSDLGLLRGKVGSLRDLVYREMVSLHERVAAVETKRE